MLWGLHAVSEAQDRVAALETAVSSLQSVDAAQSSSIALLSTAAPRVLIDPASFCNASSAGQLLFSTSRRVLTVCDGSTLSLVAPGQIGTASIPGTVSSWLLLFISSVTGGQLC